MFRYGKKTTDYRQRYLVFTHELTNKTEKERDKDRKERERERFRRKSKN